MKNRTKRQSFLGEESDALIENTVVGIVGISGGGSPIVQQLRHIGFYRFRLFDPQELEDSNLNRMVLGTPDDVGKLKVQIAKAAVDKFHEKADVQVHPGKWQEKPELLRECDIVVGCVDGFGERQQLEIFCRRNLIPFVDIGMDVHPGEPPRITGQVILSMPGHLCMWCMGFLNDEILTKEAAKYGAAGDNPQVVWPNGVLASTAVGIVVELVTAWSMERGPVYMMYDGNLRTLVAHPHLGKLMPCTHFPLSEAGDPVLKKL